MHDAAETLLTEQSRRGWECLKKMLVSQGFNLLVMCLSWSVPGNGQFSWVAAFWIRCGAWPLERWVRERKEQPCALSRFWLPGLLACSLGCQLCSPALAPLHEKVQEEISSAVSTFKCQAFPSLYLPFSGPRVFREHPLNCYCWVFCRQNLDLVMFYC